MQSPSYDNSEPALKQLSCLKHPGQNVKYRCRTCGERPGKSGLDPLQDPTQLCPVCLEEHNNVCTEGFLILTKEEILKMNE